ncbi:uncharacterized protein I206_102908 [Kwoniella pini CBS 10737]|uniref:Uncharacterized protein n=1 Tax=Kwoniella pini CBS 10737 TaxID=1296096 RepID=A0A1B9I6P5_9TREE|nr:uncharacterized protein I206_03258 [Kwoniella pini CBS 10737]OCF51192.1 hypothetical protein I206_03258 [Kwoniella pini CBS 10737]
MSGMSEQSNGSSQGNASTSSDPTNLTLPKGSTFLVNGKEYTISTTGEVIKAPNAHHDDYPRAPRATSSDIAKPEAASFSLVTCDTLSERKPTVKHGKAIFLFNDGEPEVQYPMEENGVCWTACEKLTVGGPFTNVGSFSAKISKNN